MGSDPDRLVQAGHGTFAYNLVNIEYYLIELGAVMVQATDNLRSFRGQCDTG